MLAQEGKLFHPLAYTKTFAIAASAILAITLVPVLAYHLLKPITWGRPRSAHFAIFVGALGTALCGTLFRSSLSLETGGLANGWLMAAAVGIGLALIVYRMTRERLPPLEDNAVSRLILRLDVPTLRWVLAHKALFLSITIVGP